MPDTTPRPQAVDMVSGLVTTDIILVDEQLESTAMMLTSAGVDPGENEPSTALSAAALAGIITVAAIISILVFILMSVLCIRKRRKSGWNNRSNNHAQEVELQ